MPSVLTADVPADVKPTPLVTQSLEKTVVASILNMTPLETKALIEAKARRIASLQRTAALGARMPWARAHRTAMPARLNQALPFLVTLITHFAQEWENDEHVGRFPLNDENQARAPPSSPPSAPPKTPFAIARPPCLAHAQGHKSCSRVQGVYARYTRGQGPVCTRGQCS